MPRDRSTPASPRRGVVPAAAGRSLWVAAVRTGAGCALGCAIIAIAIVAICWLPTSGSSGSAGAAIRAGVLTFLAALHGGITVAGLSAAFVPLGMTLAVAVLAWRAGQALADVVAELGADEPGRLVRAVALQAGVFAALCGVAARAVRLGSSSAPVATTTLAALVLFGLSAGSAFVRVTPLREQVDNRAPGWLPIAGRGAAAVATCYLGGGALLVAASLVVHHGRVELLSAQVGGGWSGAPVLLLGILAAPNAAIAGAAYLAGPGFALGAGSGVSLNSTVHGTLPAFPVLGAVPSGPASSAAWLLAAATPVAAGASLARVARGAGSWPVRMRAAAIGAGLAGVLGALLAWQGGGAIGSGRLNTVGASPWHLGLAVSVASLVVAELALAGLAAVDWWRTRAADAPAALRATLGAVGAAVTAAVTDKHENDRLDESDEPEPDDLEPDEPERDERDEPDGLEPDEPDKLAG